VVLNPETVPCLTCHKDLLRFPDLECRLVYSRCLEYYTGGNSCDEVSFSPLFSLVINKRIGTGSSIKRISTLLKGSKIILTR
jgi:hypothetical protein